MITEEAAMKVATTGTPADAAPAEPARKPRAATTKAKPAKKAPPKRAQVSREPIAELACRGQAFCGNDRKHAAINRSWQHCTKATEARHAFEREHGKAAANERVRAYRESRAATE